MVKLILFLLALLPATVSAGLLTCDNGAVCIRPFMSVKAANHGELNPALAASIGCYYAKGGTAGSNTCETASTIAYAADCSTLASATAVTYCRPDSVNAPGLYWLAIPASNGANELSTASNGEYIVHLTDASSAPISIYYTVDAGVTVGTVNDKTGYSLAADQSAVTIGAITGHTAQTGDSYARLGAPAGASVSADIAAVKGDTAAILDDTGTSGVVLATDAVNSAALAASAVAKINAWTNRAVVADGGNTAGVFKTNYANTNDFTTGKNPIIYFPDTGEEAAQSGTCNVQNEWGELTGFNPATQFVTLAEALSAAPDSSCIFRQY